MLGYGLLGTLVVIALVVLIVRGLGAYSNRVQRYSPTSHCRRPGRLRSIDHPKNGPKPSRLRFISTN